MNKENIILEFMKDENYTPMKAKEIAIILGVPKKEYHQFQEAISNLEMELKIGKNRKNRYRVIEENVSGDGVDCEQYAIDLIIWTKGVNRCHMKLWNQLF